jgi:hypothetical protein
LFKLKDTTIANTDLIARVYDLKDRGEKEAEREYRN